MKKRIERHCDVEVVGDKKYRPTIDEAVCKFLEYIDDYYKLGFLKSISVNVYFKEEKEIE